MTLNIKEVTLYQSGVGFFMADCPKKNFTLPVNESDINDVLKSLSVNGLTSVRFNSAEEIDKILDKIGIDLEVDGALLSMCSHLVGLEVIITIDKNYTGTVLGVDEIDDGSDTEETPMNTNEVLVLKIGNEIQNFPLKDIKKLEILDPTLQKDIDTFLNLLANKRKAGVVNLHVDAKANSWASWVMPISSWRLSYRVFFDVAKKELEMIGISIIDNTTSIDWEQVVLRIVTGKPVSFQYDLFNPLHIKRPVILRDVKGVAPMVSEAGGMFDDFDDDMVGDIAEKYDGLAAGFGGAPAAPPGAAPKRAKMFMKSQAKGMPPKVFERDVKPTIETQIQEIGSAIAYVVNYPITINRSQSALIPIFTEKVNGELCVILRDDRLTEAMDAIKLKKPIDVEKGAATIYLDGNYAGDSMIITGTEFIAFRLNQDISAMKETKSQTKIEAIELKDSYLSIKRIAEQEYTFKFINRNKEILPTILEITKMSSYKADENPDAETRDYFQYNLQLKPGNSVKTLKFHKTTFESVWITNLSDNQFDAYFETGLMSQSDKRKIGKIFDTIKLVKKKEKEYVALTNEIQHQFKNQKRIRDNLIVIKEDVNLKNEYLIKLKESETRLERKKTDSITLKAEIDELKQKIEGY
ncbi:MAG: hypothetical protein ACTSO5_12050 [Candidatus Heimdallarchaeaceae archaeon]